MVSVPPTVNGGPTDLRQIRPLLRSLIEKLDRDGYRTLDTADLAYPDEPTEYSGEALALRELGIQSAFAPSSRPGRSGWVELGLSFGSYIDVDAVVRAVEDEAHKPDNRRKLRSSACRRHLAVVITDAGEQMTAQALRDVWARTRVGTRRSATDLSDHPEEVTQSRAATSKVAPQVATFFQRRPST